MIILKLSSEQQLFIEKALQGKNILVDACIGSGKTTAIQNLCNELPRTKKVLYLTYNRLLKLDAKSKIKKKNVTVTNYHGFAFMCLMSNTLNMLEEKYPHKFNKKTVYATISESDSMGKTEPKEDSAIFTTYDSSKGLERKICVVFDFTESYWEVRISKPQQSYRILRNIFCVAASRGKNHIIFVKSKEAALSERTISTFRETNQKFEDLDISQMFEFKYKEDVEKCFSQLKIKRIQREVHSVIVIKNTDDLIDLSPCIGIYQEAVFFDHYQIEAAIELKILLNPELSVLYTK